MCMAENCQQVALPDTLRGRAFTVNGEVLKLQGADNCGRIPEAYVGDHGHEVGPLYKL
jgi:hypothetical protein